MQFPESWLREFCDPALSTAQLADVLTMAGLEVEELQPVAPAFSRIVVAEIVEAQQHPNADRLRVCKVDAGVHSADGLLQIVCGAPNARPGIRVPLALVGAELPPGPDGKPFVIKVGKLRGVESFGMLCSSKELGLGDDQGGLMELQPEVELGADIRQVLALDDTLFTLKLTPNLAHCLSVYGIAREVSALTGTPLKTQKLTPIAPQHDQKLAVDIQAPDLCGRFSGRVIKGINALAPTPAWMVQRLARCGQRSISALVDISNYVMFEYGQPSHIYDLKQLQGSLQVRWAKADEKAYLLNGMEVQLDASVGVIADNQGIEALAGIMGGDRTAVDDHTQDVFLEMAFWFPSAIAGRSRKYHFSTDAGHRFERGVDPASTVEYLERMTDLVLQICGGQTGPIHDQTTHLPERQPVTLRIARASKVLGMPVTLAQCAAVFDGLGLSYVQGTDCLTVTPPSWRFDLRIEEDLIEEVVRVVGFQNLPHTPALGPIQMLPQPEGVRTKHAIKHRMAALGYQETINFSFIDDQTEKDLAGNDNPIKVLNPIAAQHNSMRSSLLGGLLQALKHNLAHKSQRVRLFEVGRVFLRDAGVTDSAFSVAGIAQPLRLAALAYGSAEALQWGATARGVDFFDMKGDLQALLNRVQATFEPAGHGDCPEHPALHPGRSARIRVGHQVVGWIGELHPRWKQAYDLPQAPLLLELELDAVLHDTVAQYQQVLRQQPIWRDLALVVPEHVNYQMLRDAISQSSCLFMRSTELFDVYKPKLGVASDLASGERSLAIRTEWLDSSVPLTDERVDEQIALLLQHLSQTLNIRLRS